MYGMIDFSFLMRDNTFGYKWDSGIPGILIINHTDAGFRRAQDTCGSGCCNRYNLPETFFFRRNELLFTKSCVYISQISYNILITFQNNLYIHNIYRNKTNTVLSIKSTSYKHIVDTEFLKIK